ncbi:ATPase family AAA domain-containing protein 5 isoform X2 [Agrilus planipennis]|uniref:ATPase family AAA domain-containing protein 5 isoform X2 n=1 Tax=Agrilus planipennis TaxID=224129 RepID=A0A1W4WUM2_AGRPL|nr:ATPase family AAA domain-containing protein 5 isoform X2 [Agrilus planipennis]
MKGLAYKQSSDSIAQTFCNESNSRENVIRSEENTLNCSKGATSHKNKEPKEVVSPIETDAKSKGSNVVNVFQFMMDNRHKVIGRNSPGKEAVDNNEEDVEQNKKKLAARKALLHKWAASKGTSKRKNEELERDQFISYTLDERAKRMKKLLTQNSKKCVNVASEIDNDFENDKNVCKRREDKNRSEKYDKKCTSENKKLGRKVKENQKEGKKEKLISVLGNLKSENCEKKGSCVEDRVTEAPLDKNLSKGNKSSKSKINNSKSQKNWTMKLRLNIEEINHSSSEKSITSKEKECVMLSSNSESENEQQETLKKDLKLAPLFVKTSKRNVDKAALKARKEFLNSGLPPSLLKKKTLENQKRNLEEDYVMFPVISHVRPKQTEGGLRNCSINFWDLPEIKLPFIENSCDNVFITNLEELGSITKSKYPPREFFSKVSFDKVTRFKKIVKDIKNSNPDYPVYKAFKILKQKRLGLIKSELESEISKKSKKKGRKRKKEARMTHQNIPDSLTWVEKYKPSSFNDIFGNISSATELKKWLNQWVVFKKEINAQKIGRKRSDSTSSSEFDMADGNSIDNTLPGNGMILVGPHGSGKTASLYAICNELDINVLELNASSKRTGKRLLQEIQEATQSHQVRKAQEKSNSISSFFQPDYPSSSSDESNNFKSKMCLLLVEDVDLVFEQDEGFLSALSQILLVSKRPVVMTTADPTCLHLQKFTAQHQAIVFAPMSSKTLGVWLQMVCLVEGYFVKKESLCNLLEFNNGDARKTLLQLEYWVTSGGNIDGKYETTNEKCDEFLSIDEGSNDSCFKFEKEEEDAERDVETHANCTEYFASKVEGNELWWNLYEALGSSKTEMKSALRFLDSISLLSSGSLGRACIRNRRELTSRFWEENLKDSLSLNDCQDDYEMQKDFVLNFSETVLNMGQKMNFEDVKINLAVPSVDRIRSRIKKHASDSALVQIVPLSSHMDRKSVAMDYLPTLRNIAKTEAYRFTTNSKRRNRFYHYLRGLGLDVNDICLKTACETFKQL